MKKIRLIELFAGIGSQAMALRDLGYDFEHYRVVEFDKYAIASYNAIHGTDFTTTDIRDVHASDIGIEDTDNFTYMMTYSFPCQDLSLAGRQAGMTKGSGTRSGLLWEVERILKECDKLPQVLIMENVPQVHSKKNMNDFNSWISFLESKGYNNTWFDMNATERNVAQNRKRCFMVSLLGGYSFNKPEPIPLTKKIKDYLEPKVADKFYLSEKMLQGFLKHNENHLKKGTGFIWKPSDVEGNAKCIRANAALCPTDNTIAEGILVADQGKTFVKKIDVASTLMARDYKGFGNQSMNAVMENTPKERFFKQAFETIKENEVGAGDTIDAYNKRVNKSGVSPTLTTRPEGFKTAILPITSDLRVRKLTPKECWRLMGFSDDDFDKAEKVNSNSQLYKQAGNSIVLDCLKAIMGNIKEL